MQRCEMKLEATVVTEAAAHVDSSRLDRVRVGLGSGSGLGLGLELATVVTEAAARVETSRPSPSPISPSSFDAPCQRQIKRRAASSLGSLGQYILAGRSYALPGLFLTQVASARVFWPAEAYHQRYLQKGGQNADKECEVAVRCYG